MSSYPVIILPNPCHCHAIFIACWNRDIKVTVLGLGYVDWDLILVVWYFSSIVPSSFHNVDLDNVIIFRHIAASDMSSLASLVSGFIRLEIQWLSKESKKREYHEL